MKLYVSSAAIALTLMASISASHAANVRATSAQEITAGRESMRLGRSAATAFRSEDYSKAEVDSRQAILVMPAAGWAREILAASLSAQGKSHEALQTYQVMVNQGSNSPSVLLPYALLLVEAGHTKAATAAFEKALPFVGNGDLLRSNLRSSNTLSQPKGLETAIHIGLGLTYNSSCDWNGEEQKSQALKEYHQALALSPLSGLANYYYGYGLQQLGRSKDAQVAFQTTVGISQGEIQAAAQKELPAP